MRLCPRDVHTNHRGCFLTNNRCDSTIARAHAESVPKDYANWGIGVGTVLGRGAGNSEFGWY